MRIVCKDVTAETVYDVLHDTSYRKKWDTNMIDTYDIGRLTANADIGYYSCESVKQTVSLWGGVVLSEMFAFDSWREVSQSAQEQRLRDHEILASSRQRLPDHQLLCQTPGQLQPHVIQSGRHSLHLLVQFPERPLVCLTRLCVSLATPPKEGLRPSRVPVDGVPDPGQRRQLLHALLPDPGGPSR